MNTFSLCEALSWVAFRREDHLFADPDALRRVMAEHPERVRCKRPARELLKVLRAGKLPVFGRLPGGPQQPMTDVDWATVTEAQVWRQAELDYRQHLQTN